MNGYTSAPSSRKTLICWDSAAVNESKTLTYSKEYYEDGKYIEYRVYNQDKKAGIANVEFKDSQSCFIVRLKNKLNGKYNGIGSQLLKKIIRCGIKRNSTSFKLDASETSHLFYAKMGFRPTPSSQLVMKQEYEEPFIFIQKELETKKFSEIYNEHLNSDNPYLVKVLKLLEQKSKSLGKSKKQLIVKRCKYFPELCVTKSSLACAEMKRLIKQEQDTGRTPTSFHLKILSMHLPVEAVNIWSQSFEEINEKSKKQLLTKLRDLPFPE